MFDTKRYSSFNQETEFLKSALTKDSHITPNNNILSWLRQKNEDINVKITRVAFNELKLWHFNNENGALQHDSGKFFSIEGIRITTNWQNVPTWDQPIINQPEIGFLGIIVKKIDGILHFLMQAKIEPGNINSVQISPTLQATKSNYTQVHKGKRPTYLEYFNGEKNSNVLIDQLQSEQGARFLKKRNRNIIVEVDDNIEIDDNFCWMTLGQIKELMQNDNIINMDTRTVISCINFGQYHSEVFDFHNMLSPFINSQNQQEKSLLQSTLIKDIHLNNFDQIISWITEQKTKYELSINKLNLNKIQNWIISEDEIYHVNRKYFSIIGVKVKIENREVVSWYQPLVKPAQEGIVAFIVKKIHGVYHFLVQAKLEAGNFDIVELAPTVQCLTGNYVEGKNEYTVPFLGDVLNANPDQIWYSAMQSEEGGRFYQEQNKNMIIEVGSDFSVEVPSNYCWMTLNQISLFLKFNNYLNIAARSLISALRFN